jgi:solute carrier family 25 oxoglutarate transporter 11
MVKVRIQLKSEARADNLSPFNVARDIYAEGGVKAFYRGYDLFCNIFSIDSALLRQAIYATLRLGIYFNLSEYIKNEVNGGKNLTTLQKTAASLTAGGIGSFIGTPCDLVLVRMQADSLLPVEQRRNYANVFNAFGRIVSEEGVTSLWSGATPTICRAMSLNVAMLVTYDETKERLTARFGKDSPYKVMFAASMLSAVSTSIASLPFDNVKTKLQKMKKNPDGTYPYSSFIDCGKKTLLREGITGFWAGLPTYYFRVGPHAIITLLASETLRKLIM